MRYRVCKAFEFEGGHMLSKHPGRCRQPHGHSRRVEIVLSGDTLGDNDMVCDFKALKLAVEGVIDRLDHALMVHADDPAVAALRAAGLADRLVLCEGEDPTTEVIARRIFEQTRAIIAAGQTVSDKDGVVYRFPPGLCVERVRVTETPSTWAEYGE